jgi:hypothetical protein
MVQDCLVKSKMPRVRGRGRVDKRDALKEGVPPLSPVELTVTTHKGLATSRANRLGLSPSADRPQAIESRVDISYSCNASFQSLVFLSRWNRCRSPKACSTKSCLTFRQVRTVGLNLDNHQRIRSRMVSSKTTSPLLVSSAPREGI